MSERTVPTILALGLVATPLALADPPRPEARQVVDFERDGEGPSPDGWNRIAFQSWGWSASVVARPEGTGPLGNARCLALRSTEARAPEGFKWTIDAAPFRGSVVRVSLQTRSSSDAPPCLLQVSRPGHGLGFLGSLSVSETAPLSWGLASIEAGVADDATEIVLTVLPPRSNWEGWIDDLTVERVADLASSPYEVRRISAERLADPDIRAFAVPSEALSHFAGRPTMLRAAVFVPPGADVATLPVCYTIHGFGGDHTTAWLQAPRLRNQLRQGDAPALLHVFLDGSCANGHHEFADSANNGPWGSGLVHELIPAIESVYGGLRPASRRFLTGHSSGGWSALWLQVNYPDAFGGCWATAPDPVDFRDFSGVDLYAEANVYRDQDGNERPLVIDGGQVRATFASYVRQELAVGARGGQLTSFEAVFSPRGVDGNPMPLFDRTSGAIDRRVAEAWRRYDIGHLLRTRWEELAPKLRGKLHVWCGNVDTFQLDGAVRLLQRDLEALGSDADVLLVEGRDHGTLLHPHPEYWPQGMVLRIHQAMAAAAKAAEPVSGRRSPARVP